MERLNNETELLEDLNRVVMDYYALADVLEFKDAEKLSGLLKNLSSLLFFLEGHRVHAQERHNAILHQEIYENEKSVSGSEVIASKKVPELYRLRRIMTSGYKIQDAIRTNISFLKSERN